MQRALLRKSGSGRRCRAAAIELRVLKPAAKDLNADLRSLPPDAVRARMLPQMLAEDRFRFAAADSGFGCGFVWRARPAALSFGASP